MNTRFTAGSVTAIWVATVSAFLAPTFSRYRRLLPWGKVKLLSLVIKDTAKVLVAEADTRDAAALLIASTLSPLKTMLSVMEAMSVGIPCVVSNVRGNRDLIVDGKGGFVVNPEDDETFANKILEILHNEELYTSFGNFNKEEAKKYTVEAVKNQLEEIYKEI